MLVNAVFKSLAMQVLDTLFRDQFLTFLLKLRAPKAMVEFSIGSGSALIQSKNSLSVQRASGSTCDDKKQAYCKNQDVAEKGCRWLGIGDVIHK